MQLVPRRYRYLGHPVGYPHLHRLKLDTPVCAGCLLYFMLYAVSPFERVLGEAGGSLALAVANGEAKFGPLPVEEKCTPHLKRLVATCLTVDPAKRPFITSVVSQAKSLQQTL